MDTPAAAFSAAVARARNYPDGSRVLAEFAAQRQAARALDAARTRAQPGAGGYTGAPYPRPFAAAAFDRLTSSWLASRQAINDELRSDLDALRARARQLAKNNAYARRFLHMVARNVVGPNGFTLQARVKMDGSDTPDGLANQAIEAAFWQWAKRGSAEITGRLSFADACRALMRGVARDGEAPAAIVTGEQAGNPEGLALQLIDVARLDTLRNQRAQGRQNAIVMGVEIDGYQRPVAYWIKEHPDQGSASAVRYPAGQILHLFVPEEAEQVRGIPWMHAAMIDLHDLGEFNRSALLSARNSAARLGVIVSPDGAAPPPLEAVEGDDGGKPEPLSLALPGTYDVLPEGYDLHDLPRPFPDAMCDPFVKGILRRISAGFDVAYNALAGDLEGVNYSSIRAGVLEERDEWAQIQNWFIEAFLEPLFDAWFARALLAGSITLPNGSPLPIAKQAKLRAHEWQGRRWQWVDPLKDVQAARLQIQTGIASPQMVAAQAGVDMEDVLRSTAVFETMCQRLGVQSVDLRAQANPPLPADDGEEAKAKKADKVKYQKPKDAPQA